MKKGALGLAIFAILAARAAWRAGPVYDEPPHVAAGFVYWKSGLGLMTREHPPLTDYLRGLALLPLSPIFPDSPDPHAVLSPHEYGQFFLLHNRVPARRLLLAARAVSILTALGLGVIVAWWGGRIAGKNGALFSALFFAFECNLIAHASLATNDIGLTAFWTASLAALWLYVVENRRLALIAAALCVGAACASKATGLGLLPASALILAWSNRKNPRRVLRDVAVLLAGAAAVILLVYGRELGRFFAMIAYRARQMGDPTPIFMLGRDYHEGHALFFPVAIALKTSLPLLALGLYGLAGPLRRRNSDAFVVMAIGGGVLLAAALSGRRQTGLRYVLPLYPILCLAAGAAAAELRRGPRRWIIAAALFWHAAGALAATPFPLAYFNELAGGPSQGYRVLGDSNLDWGQSLPELKSFSISHPGGLILSYFGRDCAASYPIAYQDAFSTPNIPCPPSRELLPENIESEWLVVSATKWQGIYEQEPPAFAWLHAKSPAMLLGASLLVYDVSRDASAHRELAAMYERAGRPDAAARERRRADWIAAR